MTIPDSQADGTSDSPVSRVPNTWHHHAFTISVMMLAALFLIGRDAKLLENPRLIAEEGQFFYARAFAHLPFFHTHWADVGYLDLVPILAATTAARWFAVETAPYVFIAFAILAQLLVVFLVLTSTTSVFAARWVRGCAALAVVLAGPLDDLWMTTLYSKFFLILIPAILVLEELAPGASQRSRLSAYAWMTLGALSSGLSLFLAPVFGVFLVFGRRPRLKVFALILAAVGLFHASVIIDARTTAQSTLSPQGRFQPTALTQVGIQGTCQLLVGSVAGDAAGKALSRQVDAAFESQGPKRLAVGALFLAACWVLAGRRPGPRLALVAMSLLLLVASAMFGLHDGTGVLASRYVISPRLLLIWAVCSRYASAAGFAQRIAYGLALIACLLQGVIGWCNHPILWVERPRWAAEVAKWRSNPDYVLRSSPESWFVRLHDSRDAIGSATVVPIEGARLTLVSDRPQFKSPFTAKLSGCPAHARGYIAMAFGSPGPVRPMTDRIPLPTVVPVTPEGTYRFEFTADQRGEFLYTGLPFSHAITLGVRVVIQAFVESPEPLYSNAVFLAIGK